MSNNSGVSRLALNLVVIIHWNIHAVAMIQPIRSALIWIIDYVTPYLLSGAILHVYFSLSYLFSYEGKTITDMLGFLK